MDSIRVRCLSGAAREGGGGGERENRAKKRERKMERGSAAPPPFLTTPTLDIILYPPCDPLPLPPPAQPPYNAARDLSRGFLSVRASRGDTPATFMWDAHRGTIQCPRFAPPSVQGCSPKGILADSFQFPTEFPIFFLPNARELLFRPVIPTRLLRIFLQRSCVFSRLFFFSL